MRLIDADALMPKFIKKAHTMQDRHGVKLGENFLLDYDDIKDVIDNAPTIELKPLDEIRPKGKWELNEVEQFVSCNQCEYLYYPQPFCKTLNFCQNCGADMRK